MTIRPLFVLLFVLLPLVNGSAQLQHHHVLEMLQNPKLNKFPVHQRLFLHLNKTRFAEKDTIWFRGYSTQGPMQSASDISQTMIVALLNSHKEVVYSAQFLIFGGVAEGQVPISGTIGTGLFELVAYGSNMLNQDVQRIFRTTIEVVHEKPAMYNFSYGFNQLFYRSDDTVDVQVFVRKKNYEPYIGLGMLYSVWDDGVQLTKGKVRTNKDGAAKLSFPFLAKGEIPQTLKFNFQTGTNYVPFVSTTYALSGKKALDVQILPEGGDLVAGLAQVVAFRSVSDKGLPIDIAGDVINSDGEFVTSFASAHEGMGKVMMMPKLGEEYRLKIKSPQAYAGERDFPPVKERGYALSFVGKQKDHAYFKVSKNFKGAVQLTAVWQVDGIMLETSSFNLEDERTIAFGTQLGLPASVAKLTLFDDRGEPLAERLVFIPSQRGYTLNINTNRKTYGLRAKGEIALQILQKESLVHDANLSVAVTHLVDGFSPFMPLPDIRDYMVFKSNLAGKVYRPAQYFGKTANDRINEYRADLLMLTHGWRKFAWFDQTKHMLEPSCAYFNYDLYRGVVTKGKEAVPHAKISVHSWGESIESDAFETDEQGRFFVKPVFLKKSSPSIIISTKRKNQLSRVKIEMEDREREMRDSIVKLFYPDLMPHLYHYNVDVLNEKRDVDSLFKIWETKFLNEIVVMGETKPDRVDNLVNRHGAGTAFVLRPEDLGNGTYDMESMIGQLGGGLYYSAAYDQIVRMVAGVEVPIPIVLNDVQFVDATYADISFYTSDMIEGLAYVKSTLVKYELIKGGEAGALYIWTNQAVNQAVEQRDKRNIFKSNRYGKIVKFYQPKYDTKEQRAMPMEDDRVTLLWQNEVRPDSLGKVTLPFYTGDKKGIYLINVQGISKSLGPVFQETTITVQ